MPVIHYENRPRRRTSEASPSARRASSPVTGTSKTLPLIFSNIVENTAPVETIPEVSTEENTDPAGETGDEETVVDLTDKLNAFMRKNAESLRKFRNKYGQFAAAIYYYVKVTDDGDWDIKVQDEWKFQEGKTYVYQGVELRMDDPGNIHFGYVGAVVFPEEFVCFGAGMNNLLKFGFTAGDISSYFDDPHDQEMMRWGYALYLEDQK